MKAAGALVAALALGACVPYQGELPADDSARPVTQGPFPGLDPGASELESLHFKVYGYGPHVAHEVSEAAEESYQRVMTDTDLYSFRPRELYRIVVYGTQDEYRKKTGQPEWSGGVSVGNAIYTYLGPQWRRTIAHEMTHLIFFEYMGRAEIEHRWVNEGLAVYQENKAAGGGQPADIFSALRGQLRQVPLPMDQMIKLVPATERDYTVSLWYAQAESLVRFMIERGGRLGFAQFLARLRERKGFDDAIAAAFVGHWRTLKDLESEWLRAVSQ